MTLKQFSRGPFPSSKDDAASAEMHLDTPQCRSASYRLAFQDKDFMLRDELRPARLQLEFLKTELTLQEQGIESTVVIFGSARTPEPSEAETWLEHASKSAEADPADPVKAREERLAERYVANSRYYREARKLGRLISENSDHNKMVVITGGGHGIMGAANRGANDVGARNIGLNIVLPHEQAPNPWITPDLSFQFHYFAIRKMHFLMRAKALVAFPGGFGTLDELFEALTLIQTGKIKPIPVLLFGREFWERIVNFHALVDEGTISLDDLDIFTYVETAAEAWAIIRKSVEAPGI